MGELTVALTAPCAQGADAATLFKRRVGVFAVQPAVRRVLILHQGARPQVDDSDDLAHKLHFVEAGSLTSGATLARVLECASTEAVMLNLTGAEVEIGACELERFLTLRESCDAGLVYSDYEELRDGQAVDQQTLDYQAGSLRDRFDFGRLVVISRRAAERALARYGRLDLTQRWAGAYDLRLKLSVEHPILRIPEPLYTIRPAARAQGPAPGSGGPWARDYQLEMQATLEAHLRRIGAFLPPDAYAPLPPPAGNFPVVASVVIPVRNRESTIAAAVESALGQTTSFDYNVIVVDHHSTDGTTAILRRLAQRHRRLCHLFPPRVNLGIGGLWNTAVYARECGLYAVQLDSDDVYAHEHALEKMVGRFYDSDGAPAGDAAAAGRAPAYAMTVGHYVRVNFELEELPQGGTDYRVWPPDNGRNDVLRLDGLGAPRAYYVPVLRRFGFPNVSYGEDYALCLRLSREYRIGREPEPLYLARQWPENTERTLPLSSTARLRPGELLPTGSYAGPGRGAQLSAALAKLLRATRDRHEAYKDWLRTVEVRARMGRGVSPTSSATQAAAFRDTAV